MSIEDQIPPSCARGVCFRVGKYTLRMQRTCADARAQLGLSHREIELLMWVGRGLTKKGIAVRMGVSPATVDTFRRRAYAKLGVGTGAAAIAIVSSYLAGGSAESHSLEVLA